MSQFVFLRVAPNSGAQRKQNARTARACAVKTNRANYLAGRAERNKNRINEDEDAVYEQQVQSNITKKRRPAAARRRQPTEQPLPICKVQQPQSRPLDMVAFDWKADAVSSRSVDYCKSYRPCARLKLEYLRSLCSAEDHVAGYGGTRGDCSLVPSVLY